jgi:hypothetical protein
MRDRSANKRVPTGIWNTIRVASQGTWFFTQKICEREVKRQPLRQ